MRPTDQRSDVVVAGGGQVGLALAVALRGWAPDLGVSVVDAAPPTSTARADRASTIAAGARRLLASLGVWDRIAGEAEPVTLMIVTDSRTDDAVRPVFLTFDPGAGSDGSPGAHVVADAIVVEALRDRATALGVDVLTATRIVDIEVAGGRIVCTGDGGATIAARLAIAADGLRSRLRGLAGIDTVGWTYGQRGIVATLHHERPHAGRAEEHFLPGGPFALLPMTGNRSSLVWTEPEEKAEALLTGEAAVLDRELVRRAGRRLGALTVEGPPRSFPLGLQIARTFAAERLALAGDAAHAIHPIAGQGLNLGYRDVAALAETIVEAHRLGLDIGDLTVLERYDRWRRFDTAEMAAMTDILNRLFANDNPALRLARDVGLGLVDRLPELKRFLAGEARGDTAAAPRLLRGEPL